MTSPRRNVAVAGPQGRGTAPGSRGEGSAFDRDGDRSTQVVRRKSRVGEAEDDCRTWPTQVGRGGPFRGGRRKPDVRDCVGGGAEKRVLPPELALTGELMERTEGYSPQDRSSWMLVCLKRPRGVFPETGAAAGALCCARPGHVGVAVRRQPLTSTHPLAYRSPQLIRRPAGPLSGGLFLVDVAPPLAIASLVAVRLPLPVSSSLWCPAAPHRPSAPLTGAARPPHEE
jgi:hypothetical protein